MNRVTANAVHLAADGTLTALLRGERVLRAEGVDGLTAKLEGGEVQATPTSTMLLFEWGVPVRVDRTSGSATAVIGAGK